MFNRVVESFYFPYIYAKWQLNVVKDTYDAPQKCYHLEQHFGKVLTIIRLLTTQKYGISTYFLVRILLFVRSIPSYIYPVLRLKVRTGILISPTNQKNTRLKFSFGLKYGMIFLVLYY